MDRQWNDKVFRINASDFEALALEIFRFQYQDVPIYRAYVDALGIDPGRIDAIARIPFLPIRFFKTHQVIGTTASQPLLFESSGTTGSVNSRHLVAEPRMYETSFMTGFMLRYGPVSDYCILGLLPSYLERGGSSLVYMVDHLVRASANPHSGFFLHDHQQLARTLTHLEAAGQKTLLIGVTYALLDFAARFPLQLQHTVVMETGGMKGRREEMIRTGVHQQLKEAFGIPMIHSEYGMTELLSQAYSPGDGLFHAPPWMRLLVREEEDPLRVSEARGHDPLSNMQEAGDAAITGALNVIDLANVYSCSFIATDDAARLYPDGSFEVLGRLDNSDLRGCSLLTL